MPVVRFHLVSSLTPTQAFTVLTDFGPARAENRPAVDRDRVTVHGIGENWAEVTEGTGAAWERARYVWDAGATRVTITTLDSKLFGAGGGWVFRMTPEGEGSRIDVEITREPAALKARMLAALLPFGAPASLQESFVGPLRAV